ncbi:Voltage-gated potassium channel subunit beta-2 [Araneus ventricosus]|uniref:Voltage-gated potassium channel subunit beta-2 n=1 Tax=Araneus ventricosus TaxID=182803 RepID=A0A4Y2R7R4_ARAVE|nr:Voltage-gated potassium channel subunit beta-2 [Araneus ventricosus]
MEEGLLPSESSMAANPISRQVSLSYPTPMKYRNLGKSGLRISAMGLGTWVTFGSHISEQMAEDIVSVAYENGINLFDTADIYTGGKKNHLSVLRTSKYFLLAESPRTPADLSTRRTVSGLQASLERLQLNYVDIIFVNKADPMCPMEEVVRAFTHCINHGMAMYWGTCRWTAMEIMEAYTVARQFNLIPPLVEQTEYHMFQREKVEIHLPELYHKIGIGAMTWSPQAFGMFTGKFDEGVHLLSRGSVKVRNFTMLPDKSCPEEGRSPRHQTKIQELSILAEKVGCTYTQLTIAWCLKNENVQCVLVGASTLEQLYEHIHAIQNFSSCRSETPNSKRKIYNIKPSVGLRPTNWIREDFIFFSQHGPFPAYLRRFHLSDSDYCSCGGIGTALLSVSWHMRSPVPNFEQEWLKRVATNSSPGVKFV